MYLGWLASLNCVSIHLQDRRFISLVGTAVLQLSQPLSCLFHFTELLWITTSWTYSECGLIVVLPGDQLLSLCACQILTLCLILKWLEPLELGWAPVLSCRQNLMAEGCMLSLQGTASPSLSHLSHYQHLHPEMGGWVDAESEGNKVPLSQHCWKKFNRVKCKVAHLDWKKEINCTLLLSELPGKPLLRTFRLGETELAATYLTEIWEFS